jgi:hypothetical protein
VFLLLPPGCSPDDTAAFAHAAEWLAMLPVTDTLSATCQVPMALVRLNLKVSPAVRVHWEQEANMAGLSIRDWLIQQTMPGAPPPIAVLSEELSRLPGVLQFLIPW